MNRSPQREIAELDTEIARLAGRQALQEGLIASWPRRVTLYAHCSKETNWEKGEQLGLTGEALRMFVHFEEVRLDVEVAEDGIVTILACDRRSVAKAHPDEPIFVLRGQDRLAPGLVRDWADAAEAAGMCPSEKLAEARAIATAMEQWHTRKFPD